MYFILLCHQQQTFIYIFSENVGELWEQRQQKQNRRNKNEYTKTEWKMKYFSRETVKMLKQFG